MSFRKKKHMVHKGPLLIHIARFKLFKKTHPTQSNVYVKDREGVSNNGHVCLPCYPLTDHCNHIIIVWC